MRSAAVVTDSVASIPEAFLRDLDIRWAPYYIHRGTETLRDLVTIQRDAFYSWLGTAKELPKTACPSPGDYLTIYRSLASEGVRDIISIHMTSRGSGACQSALTAKSILREEAPDLQIETVDTLNASMCQGWMVIEAARDALSGKSLAEIAARVRELMTITRMIQTADTLRYLYLGGRIGKAEHLVGSLLNVKPLVGMEDGVIVPLGTARSRDRAYRMMADLLQAAVGTRKIKIAYVHAAALDEAKKIKSVIEGRFTCVESLFAELSPALGVYTGPGTAGICYYPVSNS